MKPSQQKLDTCSTSNNLKSLRPNKSAKKTKTEREVFKSTDFASKGLYKRTSTVGGPTDLNRWLETR